MTPDEIKEKRAEFLRLTRQAQEIRDRLIARAEVLMKELDISFDEALNYIRNVDTK
ncbi:MAG: hypothetical protein WC802_02375 [Patescibacteria group bacterium]|jgi:hypothetical protein